MLNKRPKNTKYNKYHKGRISNNLPIIVKKIEENKINKKEKEVVKLRYRLVSMESCRLTASQISAAELAIKRKLKNVQFPTFNDTDEDINDKSNSNSVSYNINFFTLVFPHLPVTIKPAEVRMGKGKGNIDYWMTRIKIGTPIFDINFVFPISSSHSSFNLISKLSYNIAKLALSVANSKLPVKTKFIQNIEE